MSWRRAADNELSGRAGGPAREARLERRGLEIPVPTAERRIIAPAWLADLGFQSASTRSRRSGPRLAGSDPLLAGQEELRHHPPGVGP